MAGIEDLDVEVQELILRALKAVNKAFDKTTFNSATRFKSNIVKAVNQRGAGITNKLGKYGNWRVRHSKPSKGRWDLIAENVNAPYWKYLNDPTGPYPLQINRELLDRWVKTKFPGKTPQNQERLTRKLMQTIPVSGHKYKRFQGFAFEALGETVTEYMSQLGKNIRIELRKSKLS